MKHDPIPVREIRKTGKNNQLSLYLTDWAFVMLSDKENILEMPQISY